MAEGAQGDGPGFVEAQGPADVQAPDGGEIVLTHEDPQARPGGRRVQGPGDESDGLNPVPAVPGPVPGSEFDRDGRRRDVRLQQGGQGPGPGPESPVDELLDRQGGACGLSEALGDRPVAFPEVPLLGLGLPSECPHPASPYTTFHVIPRITDVMHPKR